jgi:hypothetical protein
MRSSSLLVFGILLAATFGEAAQASDVLGGHVSAEQADCIWLKTPMALREALPRALTAADFLQTTKQLRMSNPELSKMAAQCGLVQGKTLAPGEAAAIAIGGKVLEVWSVGRLNAAGYSQDELDHSWTLVTVEGRNALAGHWPKMGEEPTPEIASESLSAVMGSLRPTSKDMAAAVGMYVYGRALLEALDPQTP